MSSCRLTTADMSALGAAVGRAAVSSLSRVVSVSASDELSSIASLPARQFRTMLRVLTRGMHVEQAHNLLRARAASGLELLADDVNTLLTAVILCDPPRIALSFLSIVKKGEGLPEVHAQESVIARALDVFERWDTGEIDDLSGLRYNRSPEIHADRALARAAAQKRQRAGAAGGGGEAASVPDNDISGGGGGGGDGSIGKSDIGVSSGAGSTKAEVIVGGARANERPVSDSAANDAEMRAASERFKELTDVILAIFVPPSMPESAIIWKRRRYARASVLFNALVSGEIIASGPNARSFALMLYGALTAGDIEEGRRLIARMTTPTHAGRPSVCEVSELYTVFQPSMLQSLATAGIISEAIATASLISEKNTPKWFFLKAAFEATKGDQFGSKHGVVVTKGGVYLTHGHNHRFGVPGDKHLRVMHSEMHALVRLSSPAEAIGAEVWIVELDGAGIGYEEAIACVMCNKGLFKLGLIKQYFSSHSGVRSQAMVSGHKPGMICESYEMALRRIYPPGTTNPDLIDEVDFDFARPNVGDPGRGGRNDSLKP